MKFILFFILTIVSCAVQAQQTIITSKCECNDGVLQKFVYSVQGVLGDDSMEKFVSKDGTDFFILDFETFQIITPAGSYHFKMISSAGTTEMIIYYNGYKLVFYYDLHNQYAYHTKSKLYK